MKKLLMGFAVAALLAGCSNAQEASVTQAAATPIGQLFCAIQTGGGGAIVAGIVDAAAAAIPPPAGAAAAPLAVIATGMAKAQVDAICAAAGGIAVSPPANPATAPTVAVVVPPAA